MSILLGMVIGSLLCNYIIYFMSVFETGNKFCDWDLMWAVEDLNPLFETLKRLTGLYVLIYVFSGKQYLNIVKNKFSKVVLGSGSGSQPTATSSGHNSSKRL